MSAFEDMQDLLSDFLAEAGELLDDVDSGLVDLEKDPTNTDLLNKIFRGFHTIKGGAGFLEATELVVLCHRGENLLDMLRAGKLQINTLNMDYILAATGEVRRMFEEMQNGMQPTAAPQELLDNLKRAVEGGDPVPAVAPPIAPPAEVVQAPAAVQKPVTASTTPSSVPLPQGANGLDWGEYYQGAFGEPPEGYQAPAQSASPPVSTPASAPQQAPAPAKPAAAPVAKKLPGAAPTGQAVAKESTIRVDTQRFDQILNLSGEIGLTKNRLNSLRIILQSVVSEAESVKTFESVLGQLDTLVSDLQSAVMKARMQPVGRVFQKYSRLARDLARQLKKDVELVITGADTEVDKTILEELNDPLVHLIRNSVDHGVETIEDRRAAGKPEKGIIHLSARQTGDSIIIEITDDGKGMDPEMIRKKAVEKNVITIDQANMLSPQECLNLIFLPGFSTKAEVSDLSGRGVGMDVVRTNIEKLKGRIDLNSTIGQGSRVTINLPLTLAILPVLMLRLVEQTYAVPLSSVREIITIDSENIQLVNGAPTMIIRGEVLPIFDLANLVGQDRTESAPLAVVLTQGNKNFVLGVDGFVGQDEVMIKPLEGIHPKGVAGATLSGDGTLVLVLELKELLDNKGI